MLKLKTIVTVMLALAMLSFINTASAAQDDIPRGKWWKQKKMTDHLNLSKKEIRQLDQMFHEMRHKLIELTKNVEKEQFDLSDLLDNTELDEAAIKKQFSKLEAARTRLAEERLNFILNTRKILGQERFQELKASFGGSYQQRARIFKDRSGEKSPDTKKDKENKKN